MGPALGWMARGAWAATAVDFPASAPTWTSSKAPATSRSCCPITVGRASRSWRRFEPSCGVERPQWRLDPETHTGDQVARLAGEAARAGPYARVTACSTDNLRDPSAGIRSPGQSGYHRRSDLRGSLPLECERCRPLPRVPRAAWFPTPPRECCRSRGEAPLRPPTASTCALPHPHAPAITGRSGQRGLKREDRVVTASVQGFGSANSRPYSWRPEYEIGRAHV